MPGKEPSSVTPDENTAWHALEVADALDRLDSSALGLSAAEAAARLGRDGPNELRTSDIERWPTTLARQFGSLIIQLLVASVIVTAILQRWVDAIAIGIAVLLDVTLGYAQERKAARDVAALREFTVLRCRVRRAGGVRAVNASSLVVGDLVVLESGDRVPADLRLLDANQLRIDESLLTGESLPVTKSTTALDAATPLAERSGMAWSGTLVVAGRALGLVVATGARTAIGEIDSMVRASDTPTPLQRLMRHFESRLGIAVGIAALITLGGSLLTGLSFADSFLQAVALAVAAIPEGLPVVLTIALSLGVSRMARHRALVRTLPAVEALGSTTVIASDKTGTMTVNRMTVERVWTARDEVDAGLLSLPDTQLPAGCRRVAQVGALSNDARRDPESGEVIGDPVDVALAELALARGAVSADGFDAPPLAHLPYEPEHRRSTTVTADGDAHVVLVKGAPDLLLELSTWMTGTDGREPLDRDRVLAAHDAMAEDGMRVLAVAERRLAPGESAHDALASLDDLEFVGLLGMSDPPRPGVAEAVAACRRAGVLVMMVTGDHPSTAASIGRRLGLGNIGKPVTGADLDALDDAALVERLRSSRIAARVTPRDKLRIVRAFEAAGEIVAVTGDGVNDAPALKAASLGVAMGRSGTDVARDAADMVLTDDNFSTIVSAVREGRVTFAAVQKATFFLISTGVAALVAVMGNLLFDSPLLFLPVQMIWFNLVSNGVQDVGLAFERGDGDELERPPRSPDAGLLTRRLWTRIAVTAVWMGGLVLASFQVMLASGAELEVARTFALTVFAFLNLFQTFNSRSASRSVFRQAPWTNRLLLAAALGTLALHILAVMSPLGSLVLGLAPLTMPMWLTAAALGTSVLGVVELDKWLLRRQLRAAAGR